MTRPSRQEVAAKNPLMVLPILRDSSSKQQAHPFFVFRMATANNAGSKLGAQGQACELAVGQVPKSPACVVGVAEVPDDSMPCLHLWRQCLEAVGAPMHTQHLCNMMIGDG